MNSGQVSGRITQPQAFGQGQSFTLASLSSDGFLDLK